MNTVISIANALFNKAYESVIIHNISDALEDLKLSIKYYSKDAETLNLLGLCSFLSCDFNAAYTYWSRSAEINSDNNRAKVYLEYLQTDQFKCLIHDYNNALDRIADGKLADAVLTLEKVILHNPDLIEPYIIIGLCYYNLNDSSMSLKYMKEACNRDVGNVKAKSYLLFLKENTINKQPKRPLKLSLIPAIGISILSILLLSSGYLFNYYQYIKHFKEIEAIKRVISVKDSVINELVNQKNETPVLSENKGKKEDSSIIKLAIQDEIQSFNEAIEFMKRKNYTEALNIFESIVKYGVEINLAAESLFFSASIYEETGDINNALIKYRNYINKFNQCNYYDDALYNCGLLLYRSGEINEARLMLSKLKVEVPGSIFNNSKVTEILKK